MLILRYLAYQEILQARDSRNSYTFVELLLLLLDLCRRGGTSVVLAIVLINVKTGKAESVQEAVEKIDFVTRVNMVTGPYDIIAYAELPSRIDFRKLINSLHDIEGLTKTETCVGL